MLDKTTLIILFLSTFLFAFLLGDHFGKIEGRLDEQINQIEKDLRELKKEELS